ncbi:hypothetical protein ABEW34_01715 [Paenibacillus algorifonticola]|uniref:hypothetical protein n=1 Tax=Paenibacillus algorifonticola TaxID=684063 RepID=UPI003D2C4813
MVINVSGLEEWIAKYSTIFDGAIVTKKDQQCEFILGKNHTDVLRQAEQQRLAEIHLITSTPLKVELRFQPNLSHGAAIFMKSV